MELKNKDRHHRLTDAVNLFDPHRFLVVGNDEKKLANLFDVFMSFKYGFDFQQGGAKVEAGYCQDLGFPAGKILEPYANDRDARAFWTGTLVFALIKDARFGFRESVIETLGKDDSKLFLYAENMLSPKQWLSYTKENPENLEWILDVYDEKLERENAWVFVGYRGLEQMVKGQEKLIPYLRSLLSFWMTHQQRWSRIRSKIFLKDDWLQSKAVSFQDGAKLYAYTSIC